MADAPGADTAGLELTPAQAASLLDGLDNAFEQVLHGRFGGGIDVSMLRSADEEKTQVLRAAGAGMEDRLRLLLQAQGAPHGPSTGRGVIIGHVTLSPPPAKTIDDVAILTEIMDHRDVNEAADATYLGTGVLFAEESGLGSGHLAVVRSDEAASQSDQHGRRQQRGWLPQQHRNNPSRSLGLGSNGHRRSSVAGTTLPVAGDLLGRIGAAVASAGIGGTERPVGAVSIVVETSGSSMP